MIFAKEASKKRRVMRRSLTISFVALALMFGAAACGEQGAQQRVEEQQQRIQEQQQRIQELEAAPLPEAPLAPGGLLRKG